MNGNKLKWKFNKINWKKLKINTFGSSKLNWNWIKELQWIGIERMELTSALPIILQNLLIFNYTAVYEQQYDIKYTTAA